jgi:hypothetical protein
LLNYDLPRDQHLLHARFGFTTPMSEVLKRFATPGEAMAGRPHPLVSPEFHQFDPSHIAEPGSPVPVVYMRAGYVQFGVTRWSENERFRKAERKTIGSPGLIPVSFVDIAANASPDVEAIRVHSYSGLLFIGCAILPNSTGEAACAVPLIREASRTISAYSNWEPLCLYIAPTPVPKNFSFLRREDNGWLQVGDNCFGGKIEILESSSAPVAAT